MRKAHKLVIPALLLILIAAVATPSATAAPANVARPFAIKLTGSAAPTLVARCSSLALALSATGVGSHMGNVTVAGVHCTEPTLTQEAVPFWSGIATFTAADGSSITVSYSGDQQAPIGSKASFDVSADVLSGTGRFDGATGALSGEGAIDFATFSLSAELGGWIDY